ncbi:hypothetical protein BJ322DRAFT_364145 [Thelephora terrestris]|uniref:Uncharacterized protein n=1 Tax=Thelephora terrestris TaxID=56493 RepID=A0A9P6L1T8_9AGAM|nr:hypothetical protein BJ322DRAFT_364145 [Thelephora terrestris]
MMNSVTNAMDNDVVERNRFDSFKLGGPDTTTTNPALKPTHRHVRSRSRNLSISSSVSLPARPADVSPVQSTFSGQPGASANLSPVPASKRNSHHRRRSSVSTRHESADLMGVSVANLPLSVSDDNINLGDKDSVRRRALWALEGKPDFSSFSKVEIPDIGVPEPPKKFEFSTKPPFPVMGPTFGNPAGKRDSFGKHIPATTSSKEQLHTLVEEDEESEECEDDPTIISSPVELSTPTEIVPTPMESAPTQRHRPAHLNLRQLALGKENVSLPTPSTPTQRSSMGLRSLTLATSPVPITSMGENESAAITNRMKRHSVMVPSVSPVVSLTRRASLDLEGSFRSPSSFQTDPSQKRRSISYKQSIDITSNQLPTPALTPTVENRPVSASSSSSLASVSDRCMSETEQHFLYQAHATLVQRITDLERALAASQPRSRPGSCASEFSTRSSISVSPVPAEPSDEMLQLLADLKSERDELNKDVQGWRSRVSDLDKQVAVLSQRVDLERREAWVARQRAGLLEVEKAGIQRSLETMGAELQAALARCDVSRIEADVLKEECERLREDLKAKSFIEDELRELRAELDQERKKREDLEIALKASNVNRRAPAFSIDSQVTDVEYSPIEDFKMALRSVAEEESEDDFDQDDELADYEREEEDDDTFSSQLSTVSSAEDVSRVVSDLKAEIASAPASPSHSRRASLVKVWTFPSGSQGGMSNPKQAEIDKFFGCLDYDEEEEPSAAVCAAVTGDSGKGLFSQGLLVDDDEFPPFLIPAQTGFEVDEETPSLDAIEEGEEEEEDEPARTPYEDDFGGEIVEGGIIFTFTPPEDSDVSSEIATPSPPRSAPASPRVFSPSQDEEVSVVPFKLPQYSDPPVTPQKPSGISISPLRRDTPPTPSSIPRAVALKSYNANTPTKASPLERIVLSRSNTFSTPPSKRNSPIPTGVQSKASSKQSPPSFIRQPQRSSTLPTRPSMCPPLSFNTHRLLDPNPPIPEGVIVDPTPSSQTNSRASKISFQTFAKLIPSSFSWSSRSVSVAEKSPQILSSRSSTDSVDRPLVTKEKQLEKLKSRMEEEARMRMRAQA